MIMYKSSAYALKIRLEKTIKALQDVVEACNYALKCTHQDDVEVIKWHIQERTFATVMITKLMKQLDQTKADYRAGKD